MSFTLKNKKLFRLTSFAALSLTATLLGFLILRGSTWNEYDYRVLDAFYAQIVKKGYGPKKSSFPQIKYVTITDETYSQIKKNYLDRSYLSRLNNALLDLGAEAIVYDIIFPHPTSPVSDEAFALSLSDTQVIYLPIGLNLSENKHRFKWGTGTAFDRLKNNYLKLPVESGNSDPFYGTSALLQYENFASKTYRSGHISAYTDDDGTSRHMPLLIKIGDKFIPSLSLAVFLGHMDVPFEEILVDWGRQITIPALKTSFLEKEVNIPIDEKGLAFIPFCQTWEKDFDEVPSHLLLEKMKDERLIGNLTEIFEGNIIFIGDISIGISDLGHTPLQKNTPLIVTHTSMLNGMLTNTFYEKWSFKNVTELVLVLSLCLGISAVFRSSWLLYLTGAACISGILVFTWFQFIQFSLFPLVTVLASLLFVLLGLVVVIEVTTSRDRSYIKNMFTRYVPDKIVNHLLVNPELIKLGGEIREISLMMSDLRGFTALSSSRHPEEVILILNRYFDEMIDIILDHYGVIDEIIGDGILGFFGAPNLVKDHPAQAVACALSMQRAMEKINLQNMKEGQPYLEMGIGINTGKVVVGNIGSEKRTKYGAVGAEVNFTGRVESYTTGGQVLITESTYKRLSERIRVNSIMEVEMKGMPGTVRLFNVTGIGKPFNIYLTGKEVTLVEVKEPIKIRAFRLDGKIVDTRGIPSRITHLGGSNARIHISRKLNEWENIRFQILSVRYDATQTEVYAKVISIKGHGQDYNAKICFTSVSPGADEFLKNRLKSK